MAKLSCTVRERKQTLVLKISNEEFPIFFGMLLLSGCHKLAERKINWETSPNTFVKVMFDSMPRLNNLFFKISTTVATNNLINKNNSWSFLIVYKKTDEWYIEWQRAKKNGTTSDNVWQRVVQWMTRRDSKWYNKWQGAVQGVAKNGNEWLRVTMYDNAWQQMTMSNKKLQWVKVNDSEWWKEWKRIRVSKIEWFYILKWNKRSIWSLNNFIQFFIQYITTIRSSRSQKFFKIGIFKNFALLIGKHLCWWLFWIKLQASGPATLLERDSNTGVFLWILQKNLRTIFLKEHLRWLLLCYVFIVN